MVNAMVLLQLQMQQDAQLKLVMVLKLMDVKQLELAALMSYKHNVLSMHLQLSVLGIQI
jgi:hypothetical protein